jgi:hypothetical protein
MVLRPTGKTGRAACGFVWRFKGLDPSAARH